MSRMGRVVSVSVPWLIRSVGLFQQNPVSGLISSVRCWHSRRSLFKRMASLRMSWLYYAPWMIPEGAGGGRYAGPPYFKRLWPVAGTVIDRRIGRSEAMLGWQALV